MTEIMTDITSLNKIRGRIYAIKRLIYDSKYNERIGKLIQCLLELLILFRRIGSVVSCNGKYNARLISNILLLTRLNIGKYEKYRELLDFDRLDYSSPLFDAASNEKVCLKRIIELKPPVRNDGGPGREKGVLLIKFTDTIEYLIKRYDDRRLLDDYRIVLEPSWSGYADHRILYWTKYPQHKIIVQASEKKDYDFLLSLESNLIPVRLGASDWVDDRLFHPIEGIRKRYDLVYVAVYAPYKRHHALFRALRDLNDPTVRIALIGLPWQGSRVEIEALLQFYGVAGLVDIYENLRPSEVNEVLNMSRVNVLLSLKEGSNKSIFEGFFANVPAVVLENNIGVNKDYINSETGRLIREDELVDAINYFRLNWAQFNPRKWAEGNISPVRSAGKLNDTIRMLAMKAGEAWTRDIHAKINAPELGYYDTDMRNDVMDTLSRYQRT